MPDEHQLVPVRGTIRAVSVFARRAVFNLGTRHEVTACVGMRRNHAALGGAVLCTTRCRQRAGGRWGGRRDRWDCRRWPRRRNGGDRRRLGRRRDRRVQPEPELRLPLPRLCRAWRLPLDTGALQPLGRMAAGPLRTVLEHPQLPGLPSLLLIAGLNISVRNRDNTTEGCREPWKMAESLRRAK